MKRTGVNRLPADEPPLPPQSSATIQQQQAGASNMHTLAQTAQPQIIATGNAAMLSVAGGVSSVGGVNTVGNLGFRSRTTNAGVLNYLKQPVQYAPKQPVTIHQPHRQHKPMGSQSPGPTTPSPSPQPVAQFQRLKVEDALSYLDQVKYKFNTQPQVYNDFLDIMKEFKSQTIDTPGVITRVSNLFKGHPELIVGFNTFLPPGYKIEVQSNGQVSVSMPSPTGLSGGVLLGVGVHHTPQPQLVHLLPVPQPVTSTLVHNMPVVAGTNTLHHISQAHQQIEAAAAIHHQHQQASGGVTPTPHPTALPGQPVEFNHAIEYVNKIKSRFSRQPDKYKRFLEILHAYQRGHRDLKQRHHTEQEVYSQVAKLFENQDDLLAEFGQFLPDAKASGVTHKHYDTSPVGQRDESERYSAPPASPPHTPVTKQPGSTVSAPPQQQPHLKRSPSFTSSSQMSSAPKRPRVACVTTRDVSYCEAAKLATAADFAYFDKVRKALRTHQLYDNFLRCLLLYTNEIISASELISVTAPFLCRHPQLQRWLADLVGNDHHEPTPTYTNFSNTNSILNFDRERLNSDSKSIKYEPIGPLAAQLRHDRPQGDTAMDIDLSTCKRLGTSYCALPKSSAEAASRKCSGRTPLCKEVLNDTWVSFPTWSEDSTFVTSRKTQYEEYIYRCEDERFELDVVIESNASTIRVLEGVQKRLLRMSPDEAARVRLDDALGGASPTIHQRALRRIYGDKVAVDIIAGLKKNPAVAVPVVLRRLKAKEEEWREAQKGFNKQWREQNEKYYLKSLDHQGINFKQNDLKALRSKCLLNEVESAYLARKPGPHVRVDLNTRSRQEAIKIVRDASELIIHHARRQSGIQKTEKKRIKLLLRQLIPDLLRHPRQPLSDDERDDDDKDELLSPDSPSHDDTSGDNEKSVNVKQEKEPSSESDNGSDKSSKNNKNNKENTPKNNNNTEKDILISNNVKQRSNSNEDLKPDIKFESNDTDDDYRDHPANASRVVCSSAWYLVLRLLGVLCARLLHLKQSPPPATPAAPAALLRLTNSPQISGDHYTALLELVRALLDGSIDSAAFEDAARDMFGIRAYPAYTLDKIVASAVRQVQQCAGEHWAKVAAQLQSRGSRRARHAKAALQALRRQRCAVFLLTAHGGDTCRMSFELLESANEPRGERSGERSGERLSTERGVQSVGGVFLARNVRSAGGAMTSPSDTCATVTSATRVTVTSRRRKPLYRDMQHALHKRLVVGRTHFLYRRGCLRVARESNPRLHAARRAKFGAWLAR